MLQNEIQDVLLIFELSTLGSERVEHTYLTVPARQSSESYTSDVKQANMSIIVRKGDQIIHW